MGGPPAIRPPGELRQVARALASRAPAAVTVGMGGADCLVLRVQRWGLGRTGCGFMILGAAGFFGQVVTRLVGDGGWNPGLALLAASALAGGLAAVHVILDSWGRTIYLVDPEQLYVAHTGSPLGRPEPTRLPMAEVADFRLAHTPGGTGPDGTPTAGTRYLEAHMRDGQVHVLESEGDNKPESTLAWIRDALRSTLTEETDAGGSP